MAVEVKELGALAVEVLELGSKGALAVEVKELWKWR